MIPYHELFAFIIEQHRLKALLNVDTLFQVIEVGIQIMNIFVD